MGEALATRQRINTRTGLGHGHRQRPPVSEGLQVGELTRGRWLLRHGLLAGLLSSRLSFGGWALTEPLDKTSAMGTQRAEGMRAIPRAYNGLVNDAASGTDAFIREMEGWVV